MFKLEWFRVFIILEVIVWERLNGLLIVIIKLFMCSVLELVSGNVFKLLGFILSSVILFCLLEFSFFVLNLWLLVNLIVILFVLLIMWLLVMI